MSTASLLPRSVAMLQDMSTHFTVLSHLTLAINLLRDVHSQSRTSPIVAALLVWSVALILVIPYRPNISYTDLGLLDPHLKSFGICTVKLTDHIKEYTRSVVLLAYFLPVCVMVWVYVGAHRRVARLTEEAGHRFNSTDSITCEEQRWSFAERSNYESQHSVTQQCEMRVKYLGAMLIVCNACLCPLMILKIIKTKLVETADYSGHLDLLYCAFVWLGSLPTTTSPMLILYSEYRR
ncbi:uncharacterized protein LOC129001049 [Macrosteles quadrilineatus]|uniref:uncharacterized protein LOC129001049 n=1 Tax=Macrosteles quadrilineatus TaxID=74068 RepID=UPI0023E0D1C4|nr:uncharacterized protein LOC129001049 [Macrosteles quadrilineatus]